MDFDLPPSLPACSIPWDRVLPPLLPRLSGTVPPYSWTQSERLIPASEHAGAAQVVCDDKGFTLHLDVKHFNPEELVVKVKGEYVVVEGKHEQRKDGSGLVTRQFNRRYRIPEGVDTMAIESAVSPEGMLVISAPMLQHKRSSPLLHSAP
ncbi:heat shock protein beta-6 [Brachyhypopomus gauderio]|uniref:heat shock protein beta-6 n=1 Tax=Brachyhypopomus gauderio TaxID=698409 RepID=UPI004042D37B